MSDSEEELSVPDEWSLEDVSANPAPAAPEAITDPNHQHAGDRPQCPVCREHTQKDSLAAQGLVLSGVQAMFAADESKIKDVYACLTAYDGHIAITLLALYMQDLSMITGIPAELVLEKYREHINDAQASAE